VEGSSHDLCFTVHSRRTEISLKTVRITGLPVGIRIGDFAKTNQECWDSEMLWHCEELLRWRIISPTPNTQAGGPPISAVRYCISGDVLLHLGQEDKPRRGDKGTTYKREPEITRILTSQFIHSEIATLGAAQGHPSWKTGQGHSSAPTRPPYGNVI